MINRYDCARVQEELAALADDAIPEEAAAHLAGCDDCRDLLHDARIAAQTLRGGAGADFVAMDGDALAAKVLSAIDGRMSKATPVHGTPMAVTVAQTSPPSPLSLAGEGEPKGEAPLPVAVPTAVASASGSPSPARERGLGGEVSPPKARGEVARRRIGASIWGAGLFAAAASVAVVVVAMRGPSTTPANAPDGSSPETPRGPVGPWHATLGRALGAGVEVKAAGASDFAALRERGVIGQGATVRTDARTRARIDLDDGTVLVLDRATTLVLDPSAPRHARIVEGTLVADVAHRDDAPPAVLTTAQGDVRVLGTKFAVSASNDHTTVQVTRGVVRLGQASSDGVEVKTGQEAVLARGQVSVSPAVNLGGRVAWSELNAPDDTTTSSGLGELRARRPGSTAERDQAVHLAEHQVRVRIVGNVARTEIEEVFRNDTGSELEGLYRFPLPPEAQVEELALDVDGRMEPGAFVDRDRAAAIWRGVIHHAAPNTPPPREEYVWVPGPWRDPALLEWQRGGRFELRVFPIPARGARRVRIAYTQTIAPSGGGLRRYVYPLPHDPGSTRVDHMSMDVQVLGHSGTQPARVLGYPFAAADTSAAASRWTFARDNFTPSGDVVMEYALGDATVPVTAWGYAEPTNTEGAYVALALRPQLPRWGEARPRDYVFVVDASRSMVGERYARATRLLSSIVSEMDRRDRLTVLACDVRCVAMREGMVPASAEVSRQVSGWLQAREPAGGSDLGAAVRAAASATRSTPDDRDVRVVYLGDGASTVGHRRPTTLALEVTTALPARKATFTAVAVGAEADTTTLAAMARAGGGVVVPYLPGEARTGAALSVLEATYGAVLRDPEVTLPSGLVSMAPARPDNLRAGSEAVITARMLPGVREVEGEVVLRGTVAGEAFEARYPITVRATEDAGNAFVPRLFGAARIADLEAGGEPGARAEMVALSQRFHLASRYTSLLVLESPAMFRAFGVERTAGGVTWTGETEALATGATATTADASGEEEQRTAAEDNASTEALGGLAAAHGRGGAASERASTEPEPDMVEAPRRENSAGYGHVQQVPATTTTMPRPAPVVAAAPAAPAAISQANSGMLDNDDLQRRGPAAAATRMRRDVAVDRPWAGGGRWMRRTWVRHAAVSAPVVSAESLRTRIEAARRALGENPNSRDRHRELFRWLSLAGELDEAARVAEAWIARDPLDADALMRLSDVAARRGDRLRAMRWLGGVADVRQDDALLLDRLAMMHARAGDAETACAYRVASAESRSSDATKVAEAVRCERALGREMFAGRMLDLLTDAAQRSRAESLAMGSGADVFASVRGELLAQATWDVGVDLDVVFIDPNGVRVSWQGGRAGTTVNEPMGNGRESLALGRLATGDWRVEVVRTDREVTGAQDEDDATPRTVVRGSVTLTALGERRVLPFTLTGTRAPVGRVVVTREEQLVPAGPPPPGAQLEMRRW